jgi:hypothetical protein
VQHPRSVRALIVDPDTGGPCAGRPRRIWAAVGRALQVLAAPDAHLHGAHRRGTASLRTGDLGCLRAGGVDRHGRLKDLLIVRGCHFPGISGTGASGFIGHPAGSAVAIALDSDSG